MRIVKHPFQAAGIRLVSGLGMTKCGGYMAAPVGEDPPADCLGRPIYDTEVRLVGPDGKDVPVGETGEITVRTSSMMLGYWNDPENTEKSLINDWFHTGDLGRMDNAGNYYFAGRAKDLIIVGTTNVAPGEVEDVLNRHLAIL